MKQKIKISSWFAEAVDHFMENPDEIADAWNEPDNYAFGYLFKWVGCSSFGCVTQIAYNNFPKVSSPSPELDAIIRENRSRIPNLGHFDWDDGETPTRDELEAVAEMQTLALEMVQE